MPAYYNEIDPYAAQWLRNLIAAGHIAPGDVDQRSIADVRSDDLKGYEQCHFFAGIGGWSLALRLAGWLDARPVWTGSCPCQPFSIAGKQRGSDDERHLWPAFFDLIRECRPASVFGEQTSGTAGLAWLDHVCADLEDAGYAAAAANLCAASVGAPHIRQRLYWVAHTDAPGRSEQRKHWLRENGDAQPGLDADGCGANGGGVGDAWGGIDWIECSDGKARPTQPGLFPLAYGIPHRVGRLRAFGNAVVPQVAAVFIQASEGEVNAAHKPCHKRRVKRVRFMGKY